LAAPFDQSGAEQAVERYIIRVTPGENDFLQGFFQDRFTGEQPVMMSQVTPKGALIVDGNAVEFVPG
jgi:hypothetical protein